MKSKNLSNKIFRSGFTIIELIVVIVVIGILAGVTVVSYIGISQNAVAMGLKSDLTNAFDQMQLYQFRNGSYPTSITKTADIYCPNPTDTRFCFTVSSGTTLAYVNASPTTFMLTAEKNGTSYIVTDNTKPSLNPHLSCPSGFITVPGSTTYGTNDFCVMKYEAKNDGSNNAVSTAAGTPWINISQTSAIATAASACTGCHLITEAEWLTIAQNVLNVAANWTGGSVGSGQIYSGHNDSTPYNAIEASTDDSSGYYNTGNVSPSNQRRTLILSDGEVIWDLAGNVWEWTSGQTTGGQPGITGAGYGWREWTSLTNYGSLSPNPFPSFTGISGASNWNSSKGVGMVYSSSDDVTWQRGIFRSGDWSQGIGAGVLEMDLLNVPSSSGQSLGFRCAK